MMSDRLPSGEFLSSLPLADKAFPCVVTRSFFSQRVHVKPRAFLLHALLLAR